MLARGGGSLSVTASADGLLTQLGSAPYSVTKHALVALAEWLSITYGDAGLKVSCLCPQAVATNLGATSRAQVTGGAARLPGTVSSAAVDGVLPPGQVADVVLAAVADGRFLILPHPEVATYEQRRAQDRERWLGGMRRLQARLSGGGGR
jgi:NAD(P)-dependent dehydrogenase (short-subunit alcohol dehydrogenase family)